MKKFVFESLDDLFEYNESDWANNEIDRYFNKGGKDNPEFEVVEDIIKKCESNGFILQELNPEFDRSQFGVYHKDLDKYYDGSNPDFKHTEIAWFEDSIGRKIYVLKKDGSDDITTLFVASADPDNEQIPPLRIGIDYNSIKKNPNLWKDLDSYWAEYMREIGKALG